MCLESNIWCLYKKKEREIWIQRHRGCTKGEGHVTETKHDPVGLLGMEAFLCPMFLVCREQAPASMTFPESQRADSNSCQSGKGGDAETREEQPRNNNAALRQDPGSPSRDTHDNISELFCRTKTPNKWQMLTT